MHIQVRRNKMKDFSFTEDQIKLLADAIWMRQRCFIAGDKRFKEYGEILDEVLKGSGYIPTRA
jgi:hypothetical protein